MFFFSTVLLILEVVEISVDTGPVCLRITSHIINEDLNVKQL